MIYKQLHKIILKVFLVLLHLNLSILIISCIKIEREPKVITETVSEITTYSAQAQGNIVDIGEGISNYGHCWSLTSNPDLSDSFTSLGIRSSTGSFTSNLQNLLSGTTYYLRAYLKCGAKVVFGDEITFTTLDPATVTDADGNIYNIVRIGTQLWMKENLKTTKYNDGTNIPLVTDNTAWSNLTTPGYCWYNNDAASYKDVYGALYNWYAVNTGKLCPSGWHVPSHNEWTILENYLGGWQVAGGKLKATGTIEAGTGLWYSPNTGATNETGFTAVPGGLRGSDGYFGGIGGRGYWWSSTENSSTFALNRYMYYYLRYLDRNDYLGKTNGFSVRCVRD